MAQARLSRCAPRAMAKDVHKVTHDIIDQNVISMHDQFAGLADPAWSAQVWMAGQARGSSVKHLVKRQGCSWVIGFDIGIDRPAVCKGLGCPG